MCVTDADATADAASDGGDVSYRKSKPEGDGENTNTTRAAIPPEDRLGPRGVAISDRYECER